VSQFKLCAACKMVVYWSKEHQAADWPAHNADGTVTCPQSSALALCRRRRVSCHPARFCVRLLSAAQHAASSAIRERAVTPSWTSGGKWLQEAKRSSHSILEHRLHAGGCPARHVWPRGVAGAVDVVVACRWGFARELFGVQTTAGALPNVCSTPARARRRARTCLSSCFFRQTPWQKNAHKLREGRPVPLRATPAPSGSGVGARTTQPSRLQRGRSDMKRRAALHRVETWLVAAARRRGGAEGVCAARGKVLVW
jgi:hypothetical protein